MSEDNVRAARMMISAADAMNDAARNIDDIMARHQMFLDDWLARFSAALEAMTPPKPEPEPEAAPAVEPYQAKWTEWKGGFCPTGGQQWVWVRHRNGLVVRGIASNFNWRWYPSDHQAHITAWQPATLP